MPTGKRASMREGPLADLFRKTAEDATSGSSEPQAGESDLEQERKTPAASAPPAAAAPPPAAPPPAAPHRRGIPHPSLEGVPAEAPEAPKRRLPSPQERLRQAFSADIPENVLERPR